MVFSLMWYMFKIPLLQIFYYRQWRTREPERGEKQPWKNRNMQHVIDPSDLLVKANEKFSIDSCCHCALEPSIFDWRRLLPAKNYDFFMYKGEWQGITHYFTAHQKKRKDEYGQRHFIIGWSIWLMHTLYFAHLCYLQLVWSQESLSGVLLKESKVHCC